DVWASDPGSLGTGSRYYRGRVRLKVVGGARIRAINHVNAEGYLAGVVGGEMAPAWPIEALKAQAIAARTYAFYQMTRAGSADFDLYSDTRSQVYHGFSGETESVHRAVVETRGIVGTYKTERGLQRGLGTRTSARAGDAKARLLPAFYHSTCGGATEDARNGLGERVIRPLAGVRCDFCKASRLYRWSDVRIDKKTLHRRLLATGSPVLARLAPIRAVSVENRTPSGRAKTVRVKDTAGGEFLLQARFFRAALNKRAARGWHIPSAGFEITDHGEEIELKGFGFGHGVGMCQFGARYLAKHKKTGVEILRFYYPGVRLVRAY
ncbi:MAG: SpoIID/LytB domain-containing protein, partial [Planctomycetia bacterium]|nr:SpoIID/LytB domain-containing protein [Planctomycetia bacterium]